MSSDLVLDALIRGLSTGSIYAFIAMGFVIVYNATSVLNFAQGDLVTVGILSGYTVYAVWGLPPWVALVVAVLLTAVLGILEERVAIRPIAKAKGHLGFFVTTFGFAVLLREAAKFIWGSAPLVFPQYLNLGLLKIGAVSIHPQFILAAAVALLTVVAYYFVVDKTKIGNALRSTFEDKELAELRGINTGAVRLIAWGLGGALSGLGGFLVAPLASAYYAAGVDLLLISFVALTIGGFGSIKGALLGGWIVGAVLSLGMLVTGGKYREAMIFVLLAVVLIVRPFGIYGRTIARRV
ncbi:MAG: branched-chain amino acid ABC transporter permease [Chloroflexota bacterium]|nr:MAG: branched-chain amino acid ABC transporter permease [Chloroflexota bacterium]